MPTHYKNLKPDPKYKDLVVAKFINHLIKHGKKSTAQKIAYKALEKFDNPVDTLKKAIENIGPEMEITSRRIGGANYQIPRVVRGNRKMTLGLRWLIDSARSKKGIPLAKALHQEIKLALKNQGDAIKKKENVHKMAEANKAFAHFAY